MHIQSIQQEPITDTDEILTKVIIDQVESQCILTRRMMDVFGKPGVETDMEFFGSGDRWVVMWTQPQLSLTEAQTLLAKVTS
ncbi:MAG: hypothetical protein NW220_00315 [Leptolyngbyaceae cyanobacterium bins.349]|nr:hypothetical protein [Leptolyngbyaceae cyanobacterium bins.349]